MERSTLERLDSFPYRHRMAELMKSPVLAAEPGMTLEAAAGRMVAARVSSLVMTDGAGRAVGIITERDILRALAEHGADAAQDRVETFISSPVLDIRSDAFAYKALGRMARHDLRHLVVVEPATRRAVGMVTGRDLLRLRVGDTLQLGDALDAAMDGAAMARVRAELPGLVRHMLAEGVGALDSAAVISQVYCDMTRRATELAVAAMHEAGRGVAPAPWTMLVLGSGGRGESLLAPDQDNAILHAGAESDDAWFAEVGERATELLDRAGIPYCPGSVMASHTRWRHSLAGWQTEVDHWLHGEDAEPLLLADIFFDFLPVYGDFKLADRLREAVLDQVAAAPGFIARLGATVDDWRAPIGLFGGFRTRDGRFDLKATGLRPLTVTARLMALSLASPAVSTAGRLVAAREAGMIGRDEMESLLAAQRTIARALLDQQIEDIEAGRAPGPLVEPRRLSRRWQSRLKLALKATEAVSGLVRRVGAA